MVRKNSIIILCLVFLGCLSSKKNTYSEKVSFVDLNSLNENNNVLHSVYLDSIESLESIQLYGTLCNSVFCVSNYINNEFLSSNYSLCFDNTGLIIVFNDNYLLTKYPLNYEKYVVLEDFLDSISNMKGVSEYILNMEYKVKKTCINNEKSSRW